MTVAGESHHIAGDHVGVVGGEEGCSGAHVSVSPRLSIRVREGHKPSPWRFRRDVGSISTVVTGIGGGAIAVQYFRLQEWVDSVTGLVALGGLIFGCGLPG